MADVFGLLVSISHKVSFLFRQKPQFLCLAFLWVGRLAIRAAFSVEGFKIFKVIKVVKVIKVIKVVKVVNDFNDLKAPTQKPPSPALQKKRFAVFGGNYKTDY